MKFLIIQFSLVFPYFFPLRSKYFSQHSVLINLSLYSSRNVSEQVSHPYKTADNWSSVLIIFVPWISIHLTLVSSFLFFHPSKCCELNNIRYVGCSESKYRQRMYLAHPRDCLPAHVQ